MAIGIDDVLAGLFANALTAFVAKLGHNVRDDLKSDDNTNSLEEILHEATDEFAEKFEWNGPGRLEEVCLFLASPESELTLHEIYSLDFSPAEDRPMALSSARINFIKLLASYIDVDESEVTEEAGHLFDQLVARCQMVMNAAVDHGILSAHEGKSAYRHRIMLDGLAAIQKRLEFVTGRPQSTLAEIMAFEQKYRKQIANRHGHIIPAHFDAARRLPIDQMYVHPVFTLTAIEKDEESEKAVSPLTAIEKDEESEKAVSSHDFISRAHRCIVLGNPGGGKSTFASYLCHELATRYEERLFCHRSLTPIHVVLRDYGAAKKEHSCSLLEFIELSANAKYQIKPPAGAFEYLLLNGRALVVLDGLDELLDTSYRKEVTGDVESFCNLFPEVPVLVTSRQVGYEQAPLDQDCFQTVRLAPMKDEQIKEYVNKWFAAIEEMTIEERSALADAFLAESQIVRDLCSNPLMLSLMCTIYRGERYIPRNRPDVYEKCALMLFERWDKTRGIKVALPFEAHIRPAMMYLADWIYRDQDLQSGVTESRLVARATEYLAQKRYEDEDEARHAAQAFIEFCTGRAWVFTDTGTTESGERLYQFTHRTFLEYFAACYLVRTNETPSKLSKVLSPRIVRSEWDVVAQLAFQIQNKNIEGAGDRLLQEVLNQSKKRKRGEWHLLQFAARCLEFLVPSPNVIREVVDVGIERWIDDAIAGKATLRKIGKVVPGQVFLSAFANAAAENRPIIRRSIESALTNVILTGSLDQSVRATEVALNLRAVLRGKERGEDAPFIFELAELSDRIWESCRDRIEGLSRQHFGTSLFCFFRGSVEIEGLVNQFELDAVFRSYIPATFGPVRFVSLATAMIRTIFFHSKRIDESRVDAISQLGAILLSRKPPWFGRGPQDFWRTELEHWLRHENKQAVVHLDPLVAFTALVILGASIEASSAAAGMKRTQRYVRSSNSSLTRLSNVLMCRFYDVTSDEIERRLSKLSLTDSQRNIILAWLRRELNFTTPLPSRSGRRGESRQGRDAASSPYPLR